VELRQEGQARERGKEDVGNRFCVLGDGAAEHPPNLRCVPRERDEPVRLTRIYTRGGDLGQTSLGDGSRTSKRDPLIAAFGSVDELNSHLGLALAGQLPDAIRAVLERVQNELFDVGADLSVPYGGEDDKLRVAQSQIDALEADCDAFNAELLELKSFVLPGGEESAARIHVARAVCRRAERNALEAPVNPLALVYLNRLSDLLFILARAANAAAGRDEPLWKPGDSR
jgi:cob(I)alamin adenosyltransferase